jgi:D-alanyl-D-alanine carboxypeptidase/D-alanyl-D-alanine-endopeptidase (penicillin-binding protein 4)
VRPARSGKIIALCAALLLGSATTVLASSGGVSAPGGSTGLSGATGASGPFSATAVAKFRKAMSSATKSLNTHSGAYILDLQTETALFDDDGLVPRNPASVEKLYTLSTALALYGSDGTLHTSVYGVGTLEPGGVWDGDLYLHGGGDPTFGGSKFIKANYGVGTSVQALAKQLVANTGITRVDGAIIGDESYFDSLRGDPSTGYEPDPELVGELSALSFNRGASGKEGSPATYAAHELADALHALKVHVSKRSQAGTMPGDARLLTSIASPPMSTLAALTATPSDNFFAEMILKGLGGRFGAGGTTTAGAAVVLKFLTGLSIAPAIVDGSGLSRADLTSPAQVVTLLRDLSPGGPSALAPVGEALRAALPIDGETGTLVARMVGTTAQGNCVAKTGTLSDASDLAGWCDGRFAFALLMNHVNVTKAQHLQDKIVEALAALDPPASSAAQPKSAMKAASSSTATPSRSAFSSFEPGESPASR